MKRTTQPPRNVAKDTTPPMQSRTINIMSNIHIRFGLFLAPGA